MTKRGLLLYLLRQAAGGSKTDPPKISSAGGEQTGAAAPAGRKRHTSRPDRRPGRRFDRHPAAGRGNVLRHSVDGVFYPRCRNRHRRAGYRRRGLSLYSAMTKHQRAKLAPSDRAVEPGTDGGALALRVSPAPKRRSAFLEGEAPGLFFLLPRISGKVRPRGISKSSGWTSGVSLCLAVGGISRYTNRDKNIGRSREGAAGRAPGKPCLDPEMSRYFPLAILGCRTFVKSVRRRGLSSHEEKYAAHALAQPDSHAHILHRRLHRPGLTIP